MISLPYHITLSPIRSTHNTRIERLWREVGDQFARSWKAFFHRLEDRFMLSRKNPHHIWLLNLLFLGDIQNSCRSFQQQWNHHAISGRRTGDRSPFVSCVLIRCNGS